MIRFGKVWQTLVNVGDDDDDHDMMILMMIKSWFCLIFGSIWFVLEQNYAAGNFWTEES